MAEFVEFRAEEWIPELEQMERIRLFEQKEIKSIATKRKEFEYKIQRRTKCKEDFLKYIQFEVDLHRIIKARRKKTRIHTKKAEIDESQTQRIANLFKQVVFKFPNDVKLWMSFFKFCQEVKFHSLVSQMLVRMLQIHTNKPELWVFAARWELDQCKSVNNARQFLTRGLRHHPSSDALYQELFNIELEYIREKVEEIERIRKEEENWSPDEVTVSIIEGKVAQVVYESATKAIPGVEFKVNLLNLSKGRKAPKNLTNKIFKDVVENHINEELTWDTIARRELEGFRCDLTGVIGEDCHVVDDETEKVTVRDRIQRSVNVFEESVQRLNTERMWSLYLDFVKELNEDVKSLPVFKAKLLNNAMEGALSSGKMAEKYYLEWIDRLTEAGNRNKKLSEVLRSGTERHPKSLPLWHARLRFHLSHDQHDIGMEVFDQAAQHLTTDASPLWILVVKYLGLKSSPKLEEVLQRGIKSGGEVGETLKPLYLEWLVQAKGMQEARRVFESPEMNFKPCLEMYKTMGRLESSQPERNLGKVRRCHELACENFGGDDPSVWLEYIKFELKEGEKSRVTQVHRRAVKALKPEAADEFVAEFNNVKMDLST